MNQDTLIREKVNEQLVKFSEAMSEGLKKPKKRAGYRRRIDVTEKKRR
ncbi:MAG: hypothetical protein JRI96_05400 [Deltaproteobacteria bacterium]|nr:hypothetical protein [Deltaproteobacteria bacterium]